MIERFEVQLLESLSNVNRRRSRLEEYPVSGLNLAILMIGFISVAIGCTLHRIPQEALLEVLGVPRAVLESPIRPD